MDAELAQQEIHEGVDVLLWIPLERQEPEYGQRVLIFAPCYPVGDQMRVRIVSWVTRFMDATHWAEMPTGPVI